MGACGSCQSRSVNRYALRPSSHMASSSNIALKSFSLANDVLKVSSQDEIFKYDKVQNTKINNEAPWGKECVQL